MKKGLIALFFLLIVFVGAAAVLQTANDKLLGEDDSHQQRAN